MLVSFYYYLITAAVSSTVTVSAMVVATAFMSSRFLASVWLNDNFIFVFTGFVIDND